MGRKERERERDREGGRGGGGRREGEELFESAHGRGPSVFGVDFFLCLLL